MKIERRRFLQAAGLAGLSVFTPIPFGNAADLVFRPFEGPFYMMINLLGGWDTTRFLDPRGMEQSVGGGKGPINWDFSDSEITNVGTIAKPLRVKNADYYGDFFQKNKNRITFINGVDTGTNGHKQGERVTWSGTLKLGYPSIAALIAAEKSKGSELPVPFLTFGGYDRTGNLIIPTRLENMAAFTKVVAPGVARFDGGLETRFFPPALEDAIRAADEGRLEAARLNATLPRTGTGLDALFSARLSENNIGQVMSTFDPAEFEAFGPSRLGKLRRQAYLALATFESGVAVSANLAFAGWDNHSNLLVRSDAQYSDLFTLLREIRTAAIQRGIGDKLHIFVGSDFGRTPYKNKTEGKDHWSVGSWMHISANPNGGRGTIGATNTLMRGMHLDANLNAVEEGVNGSTKVTQAMLHNDLRRLAGIENSPSAKIYELDGDPPSPIFS